MTTSANVASKNKRDLDFDLDARLDQASSSLTPISTPSTSTNALPSKSSDFDLDSALNHAEKELLSKIENVISQSEELPLEAASKAIADVLEQSQSEKQTEVIEKIEKSEEAILDDLLGKSGFSLDDELTSLEQPIVDEAALDEALKDLFVDSELQSEEKIDKVEDVISEEKQESEIATQNEKEVEIIEEIEKESPITETFTQENDISENIESKNAIDEKLTENLIENEVDKALDEKEPFFENAQEENTGFVLEDEEIDQNDTTEVSQITDENNDIFEKEEDLDVSENVIKEENTDATDVINEKLDDIVENEKSDLIEKTEENVLDSTDFAEKQENNEFNDFSDFMKDATVVDENQTENLPTEQEALRELSDFSDIERNEDPEMSDEDAEWANQLDDEQLNKMLEESESASQNLQNKVDEFEVDEAEKINLNKSRGNDDNKSLSDFDITADLDNDFLNTPAMLDDIVNSVSPKVGESEQPSFNEKDIINKATDLALSQFRAEQDDIERKNRKRFADSENGAKRAGLFGLVALGVGVVGLCATAGVGYMTYGSGSDVTKLSESVKGLEEKVTKLAAKDPQKDIDAMKTSIDQLNQKVDSLVTNLAKQTAMPTPTADLLNSKTPETPATQKTETLEKKEEKAEIKPAIVKPIVSSAKTPEVKIIAPKTATPPLTENVETKPATVGLPQPPIDLLNPNKANDTVVKPPLVTKSIPEMSKLTTRQRMTRGMAMGLAREKANVTKTVKKQPAKARVNVVAKRSEPKPVVNNADIIEPVAMLPTPETSVSLPVEKPAPIGRWSVNLSSYQQEWFAQSKAAELQKKGIPAEVMPVDKNNYATQYRVTVMGFNNKKEAANYARKVKGALNSDPAWISVHQE